MKSPGAWLSDFFVMVMLKAVPSMSFPWESMLGTAFNVLMQLRSFNQITRQNLIIILINIRLHIVDLVLVAMAE